jgi:hypothetical protein
MQSKGGMVAAIEFTQCWCFITWPGSDEPTIYPVDDLSDYPALAEPGLEKETFESALSYAQYAGLVDISDNPNQKGV